MFSSSLPFEVVAQIQIRPSITRLHCFASEALNMLAIIISLLLAGELHAIPRAVSSISSMSLLPGRALLGTSRASWPPLGAVATRMDVLHPLLALSAPLPHPACGVGSGCYSTSSSSCSSSSSVAARASLRARLAALEGAELASFMGAPQLHHALLARQPRRAEGKGVVGYYSPSSTSSSSSSVLARASRRARLASMEAGDGEFVFHGCDVVSLQHPWAQDTYDFKLWPSLVVASYTFSITSTSSFGSAESATLGGTVGGRGSFGSLASYVLADGLEAHSSFTCYARPLRWMMSGTASCVIHHWLCHFDFDLERRRRWAVAHLSFGTNKAWSHVLEKAMGFAAPSLFRFAHTLLHGSLALTSCVCAWEDRSGSFISPGFALVSSLWWAKDVFGFHSLCFAVSQVTPGGGNVARLFTPLLFWTLVFSRFSGGLAVCVSCSGNDPKCQGGATCALAKALATNVAVMAGTAAVGKVLSMGEDGKHILPLTWLQFLKPSVLQTLVSLAKRAPTGTPLDISALSIKQLSAHISGGSISVSEGRLEFLKRVSEDAVSSADLLKMQVICEVLPKQGEDSRFLSPLSKMSSSAGALQFVFALASQIVRGLAGTNKISLNMSDAGSSLNSSLISIELKRPQSSDAFYHMLSVWQTLLGATGLANIVIVGPFLSEVVFDIIPVRGWKVALEHFLLYISKIDSGVGWELATATSLGSHDTFIHNAVRAAGESKPHNPEPCPGDSDKAGKSKGETKTWNGKFNTDPSARPCAAFNLGQDHKSLKADGSCPFSHACDQWVSDKGKGGQCKASHPRSSCTNPAKSASKQE